MSVNVVAMGRLSAGMLIWQRASGSAACTLVCKATFSLQPGVSPLCDEPQPLFEADRYWNNDSRCSLAEASDLVPSKQRADVILVGDAVAPGGVAAQSWTTRLAVGDIDKRLDVFCDRHWDANGVLLAGSGIERIPLHWERTAGGPGSDNPPGWHHSSARDERGRLRAPNLQPHGSVMHLPADALPPAGYGPVAPHWPARAAFLHGSPGWSHERWAEHPMPEYFDFAHFNAAPRDQQLDALIGNEEIVLENLLTDHARLATRLAPIEPVFSLQGPGEPRLLTPRCDTLWIDTRAARCTLTWRVTIDAPRAAESLMALACEDATLAHTPLEDDGSATVAVSSPTAVASEPGPAFQLATPGAPRTSGKQLNDIRDEGDAVHWSGPAAQTMHADQMPGDIAAVVAGLEAKHRAAPAPVVSAPVVSAPVVSAPVVPAPVSPTPNSIPTAADGPARLAAISAAPASSGYGHIEEPSIIGPLATTELRASHRSARDVGAEPTPAEPETPATPASESPPADPEPAEVPLPLDDYPLERCAAITAALHCRPDERAAILDSHQLDADLWQRLRDHYDSELTQAIQRGKLKPMQLHDNAYYEQLETERGPITLNEYARLRVSAERGIRPTTMSELQLPQPSLMPVERVWLRKTTSDMRMAERLDDAVEAARSA